MEVFLEKRTDPVIACVCPHVLCRELHPQTLASHDDHELYQAAVFVIKCPLFDAVVGYYDRVADQFRSVLAADGQAGRPVGPGRASRRASIDCSLGYTGCRGAGAQACVQKACKSCCGKTRVHCKTHRQQRPRAPQHPQRHGLLNINLSVQDEKTTRTTAVIVPGNVFHLALLDRQQYDELSFHTIRPATLQYYDFARLGWFSLTHQTAVNLAPTTTRVLLRASSRLQQFPPRFVCQFSDCYDQFCSLIGPETPQAVAFNKAFADYHYDPRAFDAALQLWSATPHDVQVAFKEAGQTDAGLWADLVRDGERRQLIAAKKQRQAPITPDVIEIDDD